MLILTSPIELEDHLLESIDHCFAFEAYWGKLFARFFVAKVAQMEKERS